MSDEQIEICKDCSTGFYHNYNGVWLCQFCGQPKVKYETRVTTGPGGMQDPHGVQAKTTTRKGRKTDE